MQFESVYHVPLHIPRPLRTLIYSVIKTIRTLTKLFDCPLDKFPNFGYKHMIGPPFVYITI